LSITKWEIVTGTLPPLNEADWEAEFELYKATPQYAKLNDGMSMAEFKFIYFWEYFHRLWARLMGFVFLIPFLIFWRKGWLDRPLMRRLGVTVLLAAVVASFGWIMVASGLINRPWVNAYKLTLHLSLAFILYSYLLWTTFKVWQPDIPRFPHPVLKTWAKWVTGVLALQIILGGIVSGSRAALWFPSWPDMKGKWIPDVLLDGSMWTVENFVNYDATLFMPALIQFAHRNVAYLLTIIVLYFAWRLFRTRSSVYTTTGSILLVSMLIIQVLLGIFTLLYSVGIIPVGLGVLHQAGAIVLLSIVLFVDYQVLKA
jgi:cytochrome c oxidase assembly protein subunit 15